MSSFFYGGETKKKKEGWTRVEAEQQWNKEVNKLFEKKGLS